MAERPAATVAARVLERALETPDAVAMRVKRLGMWQEITWREYAQQIELVAHGLRSLGVAEGDRVAIQSENRPEWLFADLGTLAAGATSVGLYPTSPGEEARYLLADSGAKVLIAEDQAQVDKALGAGGDLPDLEAIVYVDPRSGGEHDDPRLVWWQDLLESGRRHRTEHPSLLDQRDVQPSPGDVATVVYTSGTTGPPKGAMITIGNVNFAIETLIEGSGLGADASPGDFTLSYLPLAHITERLGSEWLHAHAGYQLHFAESVELIDLNLREVQPSLVFAVPRIWEKLRATAEARIASASALKRASYRFWMRNASAIGRELMRRGGRHSLRTRVRYALGYPFLYRPLRDHLGLRKCRDALSGGAPVAPEVLEWYYGIGLPIREVYGMTENTFVATVNRPGRVKPGSVGEPHPAIELQLDPATSEVLTRHPANFAGYWNDPGATAEAVDGDGWLHTGDVGEWDGDHLRIVDPMADIIVNAGGENISPSAVENSLKSSPYVREAIVIGDRRPYLTALIGIDLETVPDWAEEARATYTTYRDLSERADVLELIQDVIRATNRRLAPVERVQKFRLIPKQLDHEDGDLTATLKVKRTAISGALSSLIEDMYRNRAEFAGGDLHRVHTPQSSGGSEPAERQRVGA